MRPEETRAFAVVQGPPGQLEIEAQEAADVTGVWPSIIIAVITSLLGGGALGHYFTSRSAMKEAATDHSEFLLKGYAAQVTDLAGRVTVLERDRRRATHSRDQAHRVAHRALDRVDDWEIYFLRRDKARRKHDPDGTRTSWVPDRPGHLADPEWVKRRRDELAALDDLDDDDP